MTLLPVAARELLVAARQPRTYRTRVVFVLVAIALAAYLLFVLRIVRSGGLAPGAVAFRTLGSVGFLVCAFMGALATADSISSEKRAGTLGLLFLTDLTAFDILTGKLVASSLWLLHLLLAAIPVMTLPVLQGGVTALDVARQILVLVNMAFFSGALGLLVSTVMREFRGARSVALVLVVLMLAGPTLLLAIGEHEQWPPLCLQIIGAIAPSAAQGSVVTSPIVAGAFWCPVIATHLGGWLALAVAAWRLPRAWQDRPAGANPVRWRGFWRRWTEGNFEDQRGRRRRLLERNPFYWLIVRRRFRGALLWIVMAVFLVLASYAWLEAPAIMLASGFWWMLALLHLTLKFWVAADAVEPLSAQRREGGFELLLSTPLTVPDIIAGHWVALRRQFTGPLAVAVGGNLLAVLALGLHWDDNQVGSDRIEMMVLAAASGVMLLADGVALGWCGLWAAVATRQISRASGEALTRILLLPWLILGAGLAVVGLARFAGGLNIQVGFWSLFAAWLGVGLVTDAVFSVWSRRQLLRHFRQLAAQRVAGVAKSPSRWWLRSGKAGRSG